MSQNQIVKKIKQTQETELNKLARELRICDVCKKNKSHLYVCGYIGCDQGNRLLCNRCGPFTHDEDYDHQFDTTKDYIEEAKIELSVAIQNDKQIKKEVQEIHYMVKSMEEQKTSGDRVAFETTATFGCAAVDSFQQIGKWIKNDAYFARALTEMSKSLTNGEISKFGTGLKTVLFDVGDWSLERAKQCNEGAVAAGAALFALEFCYHTFRLIKGDIDLKNYGKKILSSAAMTTGAMVGNIGGTAVGAAIGTFLFPFIGSAAGGVIGGLLGSIFVGKAAKNAVEECSWFNDKSEQQIRHELIKEALIAFGFTWEDIKDNTKFNANTIAKRYRIRAKEAHPDRGGSDGAFQKLNAHLSMLLAILEQDDEIKKETSSKIKAITHFT